jgi:hypothetical protein
MFFVYLVTTLIGLTFPALLVWVSLQDDNDRALDVVHWAALGAVVVIYSVIQLLRPAPLPDPPGGQATNDPAGPAQW